MSTSPRDGSSPNEPKYIVGIGASAGGLAALEAFFAALPSDSGMAFVVVQHLSPHFRSLMDQLLARHTKMEIHVASDRMRVAPNSIYLIHPGKDMVISEGVLLLTDKPFGEFSLPIDMFFRSLAQDAARRAVAIVLTGTGSDGTRGIRAVHDAGGLVMVQSIETAEFDGMPRSALGVGVEDFVLAPGDMPKALLGHAKDFAPNRAAAPIEKGPAMQGKMLNLLQRTYRIDFGFYKPSTVTRRIERRMLLLGIREVESYFERLRADADELDALYGDLLIGVTAFFRDREAFEALRTRVVRRLVRRSDATSGLRVWVAGCATGEEAYSLGILFHEEAAREGRTLNLKIFGTDAHRASLEFASMGVYPADRLNGVSAENRARYFVAENDGSFRVIQDIRDLVVFAPQNVLLDPPFTKMDLISCRNLLIYLQPVAQEKVISLFHFALRGDGTMFLGPSETPGRYDEEFITADSKWRIYTKRSESVRRDRGLSGTFEVDPKIAPAAPIFRPRETPVRSQKVVVRAYDAMLDRLDASGFLVTEQGKLVHTFGDAGRFATRTTGRPTTLLLDLLEDDLRVALTTGMAQAVRDVASVVYKRVPVGTIEDVDSVRLTIDPLRDPNSGSTFLLIDIRPNKPRARRAEDPETQVLDLDVASRSRVTELESELQYTKEHLQAANDELEASIEELQATNEELMASNEELQSTNEELHSVNEELYTVNSEHQKKIEQLSQLTNDMDNLLRSTEIGTIFVDRDFRIRKFTPASAEAFNLMAQDEGRPLEHITHTIETADILNDVKQVLRTNKPIEREVRNRRNRWLLMRVLPYRTKSGKIEGIVMTFVDITEQKTTEESLRDVSQEFQRLAYVASHDLQEPLRKISGFCGLLRSEYRDRLSEEANTWIDHAVDAAARMRTLIQDLLVYSRVETRANPFSLVDSRQVFLGAIDSMRSRIEESGAEVTAGELPIVYGDGPHLSRVFQNLIDNAIKFSRRRPARVHVSAEKGPDDWIFHVQDNGIGIDDLYHESVFEIFKRLHSKDEYPGSGIGLAVCKRVVGRHGGRMWVESWPDEGSRFSFTVPVPRSAETAQRDGVPVH